MYTDLLLFRFDKLRTGTVFKKNSPVTERFLKTADRLETAVDISQKIKKTNNFFHGVRFLTPTWQYSFRH